MRMPAKNSQLEACRYIDEMASQIGWNCDQNEEKNDLDIYPPQLLCCYLFYENRA